MTTTVDIARTFPPLTRRRIETLQVNLGYRCNQACVHCHVNAGPNRTEMMDDTVIDWILPVLRARGIPTLDLTGGAPELHPRFRSIVTEAVRAGVHVMDRCNLTILHEPGQEDLAGFLAAHRVEVVASLPCYSAANVDKQRGRGVFEKSVTALQRLNGLGYGSDPRLRLNLVYNPLGPSLPPPQDALERDYKTRLFEDHGVVFNQLYVLANMPIQRFGATLAASGRLESYYTLLENHFAEANIESVMCRSLISVDWQGRLYDCDFNQQLGRPCGAAGPHHLRDLVDVDPGGRPVVVDRHCFGCTAGQGSSCGGALQPPA